MSTVMVCALKDIECGDRPAGWCETCPKRLLQQVDHAGAMFADLKAQRDAMAAALEDNKRLVRELDILINGVEGAARQASLCDLVAQVRAMQLGNHTKCSAHGGFAFQTDCGVCRAIDRLRAGAA